MILLLPFMLWTIYGVGILDKPPSVCQRGSSRLRRLLIPGKMITSRISKTAGCPARNIDGGQESMQIFQNKHGLFTNPGQLLQTLIAALALAIAGRNAWKDLSQAVA